MEMIDIGILIILIIAAVAVGIKLIKERKKYVIEYFEDNSNILNGFDFETYIKYFEKKEKAIKVTDYSVFAQYDFNPFVIKKENPCIFIQLDKKNNYGGINLKNIKCIKDIKGNVLYTQQQIISGINEGEISVCYMFDSLYGNVKENVLKQLNEIRKEQRERRTSE